MSGAHALTRSHRVRQPDGVGIVAGLGALAFLLIALVGPRAARGQDRPGESGPAPALEALVAALDSATTGDAAVIPLAERGEPAAAPLVSSVLAHIPAQAAALAALPESDRAALLRSDAAFARLGALATAPLARALASESGPARRAALARALGRASTSALASEAEDSAREGARALASLVPPGERPTIPRDELLFSGKTTEPVEDPEALAQALGDLAPVSIPFVAPLLDDPDAATRALAIRALAHATSRREDAALALGHALGQTMEPAERRRLGAALGELGGEAAVEALEPALVHGPAAEARDRIADLEATANPSLAPRVLARHLDSLDAADRARALAAIANLALPPPPPPKARFVRDPWVRRRSRDAREARQAGREAAVARLETDADAGARLAAAHCLASLDRAEDRAVAQKLASRVLVRFGAEPVPAVRAAIADALVVLVPADVLAGRFADELARVLDAPSAPDPEARDELVAALLVAVTGERAADLPLLERLAREPSIDPDERARAAAALAAAGADGLARLDELRRDGDPIARACAAAARASALPADAAAPLLHEATALVRSANALERRAGASALGSAGGKNALGIVQGLARGDASAGVRLAAIRALARVHGKLAAGTLAQALADRAAEVRVAATLALERLAVADQNVPAALVGAIARARRLPDRELARAEEALERRALAALGKDAVPSLANPARGAKDLVERQVAIEELGRAGTDEAIAVLVELVREPKTPAEVRDLAALAIERATGRDLADPMWEGLRR